MKKITLPMIALLMMAISANAQEKRINLYGGYVFDDKFESSYDSYEYYHGKIIGGFQYGGGIEFMVRPDYGIELLYIGQTTTAPTYYNSNYVLGEKYTVLDVNLNYAMLAATRHMQKEGSKVEAYGGLMLGALFIGADNPDNGNSKSATKFAWGLRLGGNIWASEKVGIKIQAQLLSGVQSAGGSLYFGTGGAGAGISAYSSMYQFTLGGGLTFRVGK